MVTSYKCWGRGCEFADRLTFKELTERHEDRGHWDYVCPKCLRVVICSSRRLKR